MELYARKCSVTGKGINKGYCILDGEKYIGSYADMKNHIDNETGYNNCEQAYEDGYYYFTEWEDETL